MASYLLETYLPLAEESAVTAVAARVAAAARAVSAEGQDIRHLRTIYVPEDETCYHLFEAGSPESVRGVARRAGLLGVTERGVVKASYDVIGRRTH